MQVSVTDPKNMTFANMKDELTYLRKKHKETSAELEASFQKCEIKDVQIDALKRTNHLAATMLNNVNNTLPPSKATWLTKNINELTQKIKDLICEITNTSKSSFVSVYAALQNAAIDICNFIHDHIVEIALGAVLTLAAGVIIFDIVVLGCVILKGAAPAGEIIAGAPVMDLTNINAFM